VEPEISGPVGVVGVADRQRIERRRQPAGWERHVDHGPDHLSYSPRGGSRRDIRTKTHHKRCFRCWATLPGWRGKASTITRRAVQRLRPGAPYHVGATHAKAPRGPHSRFRAPRKTRAHSRARAARESTADRAVARWRVTP